MPDLLIELLSEEIPARMQARAAEDLRRLMTDGLVEAGLTYAAAQGLVTPRRLVLAVSGLSAASPTRIEERKGPRADAPAKAVEGFLRATGLPRDALEERETPKGAVLFARLSHPGRPAADIVAEVLSQVIATFPWPKSMRWGAGSLRWVRPLQAILCLLSDEAGARIVPLEIGGLRAGDTTRGHRFMAPEPFSVTGFEDYAAKLKRAHVILDPRDRAEAIRHDVATAAFAHGLEPVPDAALLAEVAGLVEWPVVLTGEIETRFRDLPPEVLQTSMREHQKFFSLRDPASGQILRFATVANRETADQGQTILAGNQKVLAARLSDARFFWDNDLHKLKTGGMAAMAAPLAQVTFHRALGTQADRIARITALAGELAPQVGAGRDLAILAAGVVKADLASGMVYEFPELQGVMGGHYARATGLPDAVAEACATHYAPLGPTDAVPQGPVARTLALADKLDTLAGFWYIDEKPTGSRDPFALRRAALGVIRILLEGGIRLRLEHVLAAPLLRLEQALGTGGAEAAALLEGMGAQGPAEDPLAGALPEPAARLAALRADLLGFFHDRLKVFLRDEGLRHDVIEACLALPGRDDLVSLVARARALQGMLGAEAGENLVQGFRRANNILSQAEERDGVSYSFGPDPKFAETPSEQALFAALDGAEAAISSAIKAEDFARAMEAMALLRAPIDAFFEDVQVNSDNAVLRRNRLNLLHRIRETCLRAADLTRLEG